ncbi:hypothetical protein [Streptomyces chartreusis]|uniref:hypothetical protein n=1 Tax=Streptomyces chartreusis TaxID=1969 RepID=UPI00369171C2
MRCDINVLSDGKGRRLEIVNVNALPLEARTGTDMIYYHVPTESFVLVQYKRLDPRKKEIRVDERLRSQLDRLAEVAKLSSSPERPREWRLGSDPCFLKLAYWPENTFAKSVDGLTPGMYLPESYVRLLLEDECTHSSRGESKTRLLGYGSVERHLVGAQFVQLVKEGLVGTVRTTREDLWEVVKRRAEQGQNILLGREYSTESAHERQQRTRSRSSKDGSYVHKVYTQDMLFDSGSAE